MTTTNVIRTAKTYARDLAERVIWTFLLAAGGIALAAGPADMLNVSFWHTVATAGIAAVGSLLKGLFARVIGDPNSASTSSAV
ncbi:hypothetical protein [Streptomyces albireticuli]|uniref:Holin n=1 Tax=Streptomyces albireticuli TaxID=1940 RepID=A0A2A2D4C3_9ACTN|nr:hypothetical protein [Streptomyces albireticuli]MCD9196086.1 hypothetical protein [Streptomyces albireticuli]PAU46162.1 hypothetical protein CK936_25535 [Streptomyces albireticuli]